MEHLIKLKNFPTRPFTFSDIGNWHFKQKQYEDLKQMTDVYGVFSVRIGMKRAVSLSSAEKEKEALVTKGPQFAGRIQN